MSPPSHLAVLAFVAAVPLASAQDEPPPLKVTDVRAVVGDWIVLRAETEGRIVRWKSLDRGLATSPRRSWPFAIRRRLLPPHRGRASIASICVTAKGDVPSEIIEFTVTVEADGPDPPEPKPPEPIDPLTRKLREALQTDSGEPAKKREYVAILAGFYSAMAKHVSTDQVATVGDLLERLPQRHPVCLARRSDSRSSQSLRRRSRQPSPATTPNARSIPLSNQNSLICLPVSRPLWTQSKESKPCPIQFPPRQAAGPG